MQREFINSNKKKKKKEGGEGGNDCVITHGIPQTEFRK